MDRNTSNGTSWNNGGRGSSKGFEMIRQRNRSTQALGLGILTALLVLGVGILVVGLNYEKPMKKQEEEPRVVFVEKPAQIEMVKVLVPTRNIRTNEELKRAYFKEVELPKSQVGEASVRGAEMIDGMFAKSAIPADEPLNRQLITKQSPGSQLAPLIPPGFRAVAIRVDEVSSIEGWVTANTRVDIDMIHQNRGETVISTLVQNALILSAQRSRDAEVKPGDPIPGTVTVMVSIPDARKIHLAQKVGQLTLAMRSPEDDGKVGSDPGTWREGDLKPRSGDEGDRGPKVIVRNPDGSKSVLYLDDRGNLKPE